MWWAFLLACSCGQDPKADFQPQVAGPSRIVVEHDPKALEAFPQCVAYAATVCEVCGAESEPCRTVKKVNDVCAQKGTCKEASCAKGSARLRADPKGADSELCTE